MNTKVMNMGNKNTDYKNLNPEHSTRQPRELVVLVVVVVAAAVVVVAVVVAAIVVIFNRL
jgi:t-SNARE complex subunit (syntaxin)